MTVTEVVVMEVAVAGIEFAVVGLVIDCVAAAAVAAETDGAELE